ncbi:MAG: hypothetical protein H0Z19_11685 [Archaeoglobus sp.]|uniref:hypothetical protein n=1 Tax=Archaeoglobus sp. TaxID=1872626 RepID=UPI001E13EFF7|nr:hypothetical protein [Archaeoglobus sp.]MBO8181109.1 hypothetical protein [Archaeoglobus sp.]
MKLVTKSNFPPYNEADYIIFKDGDYVYAKNGKSGRIEYQSSDIEDVLEYTANALEGNVDGENGGIIAITKGSYKFTRQVTIGGGIILKFNNAMIDLTEINSYAFYFDASGMSNDAAKPTGIIGPLLVVGDTSNPNAGFVHLHNVIYGITLKDIHEAGVANSLRLTGKGYLGYIEHCDFGLAGDNYGGSSGTKIYIEGGTPDNTYNKNGLTFINTAIQGKNLDSLIYIKDPGENIVFDNVWIETSGTNMETIYIENASVRISNAYIYVGTAKVKNSTLKITNTKLHTTFDDVYSSDIFITNSMILSKLLNITNPTEATESIFINGNYFSVPNDRILYSEYDLGTVIITNNKISASNGIKMIKGADASGYTRTVIISNNQFTGGSLSGENYLDLETVYVVITGNTFKSTTLSSSDNIIKVSNAITTMITNNSFATNVSPFPPNISVNSLYKILKNNVGYTTENSSTATFSGDGSTTQFTIAHKLVSTPSKVLVTPMSSDAAGDFYVTADDTNIYVNYKTAPPSGTNNIKLSWYAEV